MQLPVFRACAHWDVLAAEDGRLLGDFETEQLCEKLTLLQLSALREGLEERIGSRADQQSLLRVGTLRVPRPTTSSITRADAVAVAMEQRVILRACEDSGVVITSFLLIACSNQDIYMIAIRTQENQALIACPN